VSSIYGYVQAQDAGPDMEKMRRWNLAYGAEDEEVQTIPHCGMGCCLEHLSTAVKQSRPILRSDGVLAVMDALLYNRKELIEKCGIVQECSDEEILFSLICQFGFDALREVNGDFAGAFYREKEHILTLFRDHMGVRPLFYYMKDGFVAYSTDIRGLTALPQVDCAVSEEWLYKMMSGYSCNDQTATEFAHIFCVRPASYMTFSLEEGAWSTQESSYWRLGESKIRCRSAEQYRTQLRLLITDAVQRRLDAVSGLVGAELSGGLDSGVIDILIHRSRRECVYFSWSVDPKEVPMAENDERLVIADICKQEGITCHYGNMKIDLGTGSRMAESLRRVGVAYREEESSALRYALPPYINTTTICETSQFVRGQGARAVFTGHGGDEGVSHRCNAYELFYHHEYYHYFREVWSATHGQNLRILRTLKKSFHNIRESRKQLKTPYRSLFKAPDLLKPEFAEQFGEADMPVLHFAYDSVSYIQEGGSRNRLDNVALQGAYCGVRYLIPYLDYRVIDYAVSIPRYLYRKGRMNRYIFREAFRDIMPDSLYTLRFKEDNSRKNMKEDTDWYEEFSRQKTEIVRKLDREHWKKYLDFDRIEEWRKKGKPSEEERLEQEIILGCLLKCAMVESLVEKSREI
jgi:asparagine synthase (glutamine-hydrolysing)